MEVAFLNSMAYHARALPPDCEYLSLGLPRHSLAVGDYDDYKYPHTHLQFFPMLSQFELACSQPKYELAVAVLAINADQNH